MRQPKYSVLLYCLIGISIVSCKYHSEEKNKELIAKVDNGYVSQSKLEQSMARGQEVYVDFCVTCHRSNGEGIKGTFPPLAASDYLMNNRIQSIQAVKYGQKGAIVVNGITYNSVMSAQGLDDEEVADVLNFVMNSWGNQQGNIITTEEVASTSK